jgi:hypothetical protein
MAVLTASLAPIQIGVDIGQLQDNTALSVAEVTQHDTGRVRYGREVTLGHPNPRDGTWIPPTGIYPVMVTEYTIRHIGRLPLGTSYPDVALHLADMLCSPLFVGRLVTVLMDVTGVGRPVFEDVKREFDMRKYGHWKRDGTEVPGKGDAICNAQFKPISFVHGEAYNQSSGSLGKAYLVSRLQSLLQGGRVHGPDTSEMNVTLAELRVYQIKVSQEGKETFGAMRTGTHDDLATALGLSVLEDPHAHAVTYSQRIF